MKQMQWKRIGCLLLAVVLAAVYVPAAARAAELCPHHEAHVDCGYVEGESECTYQCEECLGEEEEPVTSGQCGENVYWSYDGEGTITISGTGEMTSRSYNVDIPWEDYKAEITTVIVEEGVTSIGYGAFQSCKNLTDVTLPESLTLIDAHGFSYCRKLEEIRLPEGLQALGGYAFYGCDLKSVHLGAAILRIDGQGTFDANPDLAQITVATENPNYCAVDNVLFTKDMKDLVCYPGGLTQESYTVPDGVTSIGRDNYACSVFSRNAYIKTVVLPDTVTILRGYTFWGCKALSQVNLPDGLQELESLTFSETNIKNIVIPASVNSIDYYAITRQIEEVTFTGDVPEIDSGAFHSACTATVYYPGDNATWTEDKLQNYGGNLTWIPYCVGEHVYEEGACVNCGKQFLTITQQPEDTQQEFGQKFAITVKAEGEGLTYQWYVKEAGAKAFKVSANKTASYAYTMQTYMHNRQVYCVVTDQYGYTVTTETATITRPPQELKITAQPQDAQANVGEKFSISPKVEGDGLIYQWYVKEAGAKTFKVSSIKGSAYALTMQKYMIGRQVYCVITDKNGNTATTDVATISLPPVELKILEQPTDVYAELGAKYSVKPVVEGDGLTYQWYVKEASAKDFKVSVNKTAAYAYTMQTYMNGRTVYCVITDKYGNQVQTEPATIYMVK